LIINNGIIPLLMSATKERLMKQRLLQRTVLVLFMTVVVAFAIAGPPPPPPPPAPPAGIPIDGAVFLLLGAGLVYGARKLYKDQ
jgi:hypothetical protein